MTATRPARPLDHAVRYGKSMSTPAIDLAAMRLTPAMKDALLDWRLRFRSVENRTAQALKDRGLVYFEGAFGFPPTWGLTWKGMQARAAIVRERGT